MEFSPPLPIPCGTREVVTYDPFGNRIILFAPRSG